MNVLPRRRPRGVSERLWQANRSSMDDWELTCARHANQPETPVSCIRIDPGSELFVAFQPGSRFDRALHKNLVKAGVVQLRRNLVAQFLPVLSIPEFPGSFVLLQCPLSCLLRSEDFVESHMA